jgi:hypothetical protein
MPQNARSATDERQRAQTGRRMSAGNGNPNKNLDGRTIDELRNRARKLRIEGRSSMTRSELISAIRSRG